MNHPVVIICGPTGVGKTRLAAKLAPWLPVEVVSADSRQLYRGMDIGTGKPTREEREAVPHHLLDLVNPDEPYHAARFLSDAEQAISAISQRGSLPLVVGGTGLYIRALLRGLVPAPPADPRVREALREVAERDGAHALHARLQTVDPVAAKRIHPRDGVRIIRALEIYTLTGRPHGLPTHWHTARQPSHVLMIGLTMDREALYRSLEARVDQMIADGLAHEVRSLLRAGYSESLSSMRGIGYHHLAMAFRGQWSMEDAIRMMKRDTKRYAKRQWTWFQREPGIRWLQADAPNLDLSARTMIASWLPVTADLALTR
jgi:tRNA dimethylallyltransferase